MTFPDEPNEHMSATVSPQKPAREFQSQEQVDDNLGAVDPIGSWTTGDDDTWNPKCDDESTRMKYDDKVKTDEHSKSHFSLKWPQKTAELQYSKDFRRKQEVSATLRNQKTSNATKPTTRNNLGRTKFYANDTKRISWTKSCEEITHTLS